jgi:transcriptional regulator with XRE-family HTH domain
VDDPSDITPERRAIGRRIKEAIERKGITQNELARHFDKVHSASNGWTTGRTQPSLEELADICRLTGQSADWILNVRHSPRPATTPARSQSC